MASVYSSLVHRLWIKSKVSFHSMMNSAMRNEYEQLSPELPACFQSFIQDRLVGLNLALTFTGLLFLGRINIDCKWWFHVYLYDNVTVFHLKFITELLYLFTRSNNIIWKKTVVQQLSAEWSTRFSARHAQRGMPRALHVRFVLI